MHSARLVKTCSPHFVLLAVFFFWSVYSSEAHVVKLMQVSIRSKNRRKNSQHWQIHVILLAVFVSQRFRTTVSWGSSDSLVL